MKRLTVLLVLAAVLCGSVFAANEVAFEHTTGKTTYMVIVRPSDLYTWEVARTAWYAEPNSWTECKIAATEHTFNTGLYSATFPPEIAAGSYLVRVKEGAGVLATDTKVSSFAFEWTGAAEITTRALYMRAIYSAAITTGGAYATVASTSTDSVGLTGVYPDSGATNDVYNGYWLIALTGSEAGMRFPIDDWTGSALGEKTAIFTAGSGTVTVAGTEVIIVPKGGVLSLLWDMTELDSAGNPRYTRSALFNAPRGR